MASPTRPAFSDDAYLTACEGKVLSVNESGGIVLDQTNFYAASGGQPGDTGMLELEDGTRIEIVDTFYASDRSQIVLLPKEGQPAPDPGRTVVGHIDWARRYQLMKMHTACHLLSVVCPYPITGAAVNVEDSRVDFDLKEITVSKEEVSDKLMELVNENHPVFSRWISRDELENNPELVKSKNVRPPSRLEDIRLVCIGEDASIDSQPCGGTHVTETAEIGPIHIGKIEKKGRENRRFRLRFGHYPN